MKIQASLFLVAILFGGVMPKTVFADDGGYNTSLWLTSSFYGDGEVKNEAIDLCASFSKDWLAFEGGQQVSLQNTTATQERYHQPQFVTARPDYCYPFADHLFIKSDAGVYGADDNGWGYVSPDIGPGSRLYAERGFYPISGNMQRFFPIKYDLDSLSWFGAVESQQWASDPDIVQLNALGTYVMSQFSAFVSTCSQIKTVEWRNNGAQFIWWLPSGERLDPSTGTPTQVMKLIGCEKQYVSFLDENKEFLQRINSFGDLLIQKKKDWIAPVSLRSAKSESLVVLPAIPMNTLASSKSPTNEVTTSTNTDVDTATINASKNALNAIVANNRKPQTFRQKLDGLVMLYGPIIFFYLLLPFVIIVGVMLLLMINKKK